MLVFELAIAFEKHNHDPTMMLSANVTFLFFFINV